jgi:hypothetical protein
MVEEDAEQKAVSPSVMLGLRGIAALEKLGFWAIVGWVAVEAIHALAGKETLVNLTAWVTFQTGDKPWEVVAYGVLTAWAVTERVFRHRKTRDLANRIRTLESHIDSQRESSQLSPQGQTNPRDRM